MSAYSQNPVRGEMYITVGERSVTYGGEEFLPLTTTGRRGFC